MRKAHSVLCAGFFLVIAAHAPLVAALGSSPSLALRYALAALIILRWLPLAFAEQRHAPVIRWACAYCALAGVSIVWSTSPSVSALALLDLVVVTAAAVSIGAAHSAENVVRVLAKAGLGILLASLAVMAFLPATQLDDYGRASWIGIFSNPNEFGRQMVLASVFCAALATQHRSRRYLIGATICIAVAVLTGSAQVIVVGATALATVAATRLMNTSGRARGAVTLILIGATALSGYFAISGRETIFAALGKDQSITYRVPIWRSVIDTFGERWLTGYGYSSYWRDPSVMSDMATLSRESAQQAHNSALELTAQVGVVGVLIVGVILIRAAILGYRTLRSSPVGATALMTVAVVLTTYSITASVFGRSPEQIYWVALIALTMATSATRPAPPDGSLTPPGASKSPQSRHRESRRGHALVRTSNT